MTKPASVLPNVPIVETPTADRDGRGMKVKFRTDRDGLKRAQASQLVAAVSAPRTETVRSLYFDTASRDLRKNGIILRIHRKGGKPILGVKVAQVDDGLFSRKGVEVHARDLQPDLTLFDEATASELIALVGDRPLAAQFETIIKRRTILVERGRSQIEVAFDEGSIAIADQSLPLTEIQLELKSGDEPALYDLAMSLADELPLRLDFVSKGERGFQAMSQGAAAVKATPIAFAPGATLDDAVQAVLSNTLLHFVANWAAIREAEDPNAIHQMRVALRRMRAALAMFKRALLARTSIFCGERPSGLPRRSVRREIVMFFVKPQNMDRWRTLIDQRTAIPFSPRSRSAGLLPMPTHAHDLRIGTQRCSS
jgi:inorganic triphosphatase YgiF